MCECCGGDCKLYNSESTLDYFRLKQKKREVVPQPLNEAYHNEVLEAYQKISDTFDGFTRLMRERIPYENWPKDYQIIGVSEELKSKYDPVKDPCQECKNITDKCICHLEDIIAKGLHDCSPQSRPFESFRAMMTVMLSWKKYLDSIPIYANKRNEIVDLLKAQGLDPLKGIEQMAQRRLESIGNAHNMIMSILQEDIFKNLASKDPYWIGNTMSEEEKLDEIRCKLNCVRDNLWSVINILVPRAH